MTRKRSSALSSSPAAATASSVPRGVLCNIFYLAVDFPSVAKPFSNRFTLESDHQYDLTNPCIGDGFDCPFYYQLVSNRMKGLWPGLGERPQPFSSARRQDDGFQVKFVL